MSSSTFHDNRIIIILFIVREHEYYIYNSGRKIVKEDLNGDGMWNERELYNYIYVYIFTYIRAHTQL